MSALIASAWALRRGSVATTLRNVNVITAPGDGGATGELNVIGMRVEEATERLDKYLDRAYADLDHRSISLFGTANKVLRQLRRFRVDEKTNRLSFEYDASRLCETDVEAVLLRFELPIKRKSPIP